MTQCERVLDFIDRNGSITVLDAFNSIGVTQLGTRISEIEKQGIPIARKRVVVTNRYNEKCRVCRYWIATPEQVELF